MSDRPQHRPARRLLVVMPSWLGDIMMATPTLRALRQLYPQAHITALVRKTFEPLLDANPSVDRVISIRSRRPRVSKSGRRGLFVLSRRLSRAKFDTAVLLPNGFRAALLARVAGIPRRVGYDRDGRGFLLTDRLLARRNHGKFVPVPTRDYFLGIARYLGAVDPDPAMQLFTHRDDDARADELLQAAGVNTNGDRPLVLLNPGASYGQAKWWPTQRFATLADQCVEKLNAVVAINGSPKERPILDRLMAEARHPLIDLSRHGVDLRLLKSVFRHVSLLITNDTGPRHMAAATGTPVVTIFGPTDPAWTEMHFPAERQVRVDVYCGPCQKKKCPLRGTPDDHQCMTLISPEMVYQQAAELLATHRGAEVSA